MIATLENKIKITFEFNSLNELSDLYGTLNCGCVHIHKSELSCDCEKDLLYISQQWDKLSSFAENFNPANFR